MDYDEEKRPQCLRSNQAPLPPIRDSTHQLHAAVNVLICKSLLQSSQKDLLAITAALRWNKRINHRNKRCLIFYIVITAAGSTHVNQNKPLIFSSCLQRLQSPPLQKRIENREWHSFCHLCWHDDSQLQMHTRSEGAFRETFRSTPKALKGLAVLLTEVKCDALNVCDNKLKLFT